MNLLVKSPDTLGAWASGLCLVHCIATPFLFMVPACVGDCEAIAPVWWKQIDYIFLGLSFLAVYHSTQATSSSRVQNLMWITWTILGLLVLNEKFEGIRLPELFTYISAGSLVTLHLYNRRYCQCRTDKSCANDG